MLQTGSQDRRHYRAGQSRALPGAALELPMNLTNNILCYGSEEPLPEEMQLHAGPLSLTFVSGELRHIYFGDHEVLRRICVAVRDRTWRTLPTRLLDLKKTIRRDSFEIHLEAENKQRGIDFYWKAVISGSSGGTVRFVMDGVAQSTFLKNRIGICVLHPIRECAGQPCSVERVDGVRQGSSFPRYISPHQVFKDVRSIAHEVEKGITAEVCFEGDTFETEDQRNWSDASFKTYCPPLALPYPNEICAGTKVSQSVTLAVKGAHRPYIYRKSEPVEIVTDGSAPRELPRIGLGMSSTEIALGRTAIKRLRALNLSHLRVDIASSVASAEARLQSATEEAGLLGCRLEVAVFLSDSAEEELNRLRSVVERIRPPVVRWLVFHESEKSTSAKWVAMARANLADYQPTAKFGGGTNVYFAELGRGPTPGAEFEVVSTSLNPQVHLSDHENVAENLEAQGDIVRSARHFWPDIPLSVTPITLRPRLNADVTGLEPGCSGVQMSPGVDVRQMSLFGAAWTAGSLKYLCEAGVHSATYYETVGWRGVMEGRLGSPLPEEFHSQPNAVFPMYHVFADFGEFAGGTVVPSKSTFPRRVESLVLKKNGAQRILLGNLSAEIQKVRFQRHKKSKTFRVRLLDANNADLAMNSPEAFRATPGEVVSAREQFLEVQLPPFSVARMDSE